jgi:hypothetical protein
MDLGKIGVGGVDWIRLAQDRDRWRAVVSAVMNLRGFLPQGVSFIYIYINTIYSMHSITTNCGYAFLFS